MENLIFGVAFLLLLGFVACFVLAAILYVLTPLLLKLKLVWFIYQVAREWWKKFRPT